jgi:hypothetical protein
MVQWLAYPFVYWTNIMERKGIWERC